MLISLEHYRYLLRNDRSTGQFTLRAIFTFSKLKPCLYSNRSHDNEQPITYRTAGSGSASVVHVSIDFDALNEVGCLYARRIESVYRTKQTAIERRFRGFRPTFAGGQIGNK